MEMIRQISNLRQSKEKPTKQKLSNGYFMIIISIITAILIMINNFYYVIPGMENEQKYQQVKRTYQADFARKFPIAGNIQYGETIIDDISRTDEAYHNIPGYSNTTAIKVITHVYVANDITINEVCDDEFIVCMYYSFEDSKIDYRKLLLNDNPIYDVSDIIITTLSTTVEIHNNNLPFIWYLQKSQKIQS